MTGLKASKFLRLAAIAGAVIVLAHVPSNSAYEPEAKDTPASAPEDMLAQCKQVIERAAGGVTITLRSVI